MKQEQLSGRIGSLTVGYDIHLSPTRAGYEGRFGGVFVGKNVQLEVTATTVAGRVGGMSGFDVHASLGSTVTGRMGGAVIGEDFVFTVHGDEVTGRMGGNMVGNDFHFTRTPQGIAGRLGGPVIGKDLRLDGEAPIEILAIVGLMAFKTYNDDEQNSSS